jgi:cyclophilin family peptidyl-prolyl cis-trans isomerase
LEAARKRRQQRRIALFAGLGILVVVVAAFAITLVAGDDEKASDAKSDTSIEEAAPCPQADGTSERRTAFKSPFPESCTDPTKTYTAVMETDVGVIKIALDASKAPRTVNNFVSLARYHFYDGLTFHRVVKDYVIQGGDPEGSGSGDAGYRFEDELPSPADYAEGSIAMANSGPNTNGSQFFILTSPGAAAQLLQAVGGEAKYNLFGKVTEGLDVVKRIEADGPDTGEGQPKVVHRMVKVTIEER